VGTVKRGTGTRIQDRFKFWSVEDCACVNCINYKSKKRPCPLPTCAIQSIKEEAIRREADQALGSNIILATTPH